MPTGTVRVKPDIQALPLWQRLARHDATDATRYSRRLCVLAGQCEKLMDAYFRAVAPQLTDHGSAHLRSVGILAHKLVAGLPTGRMSPVEIFVLLASCWAHDLGYIQPRTDGEPADATDVQTAYREGHAAYSEKYVTGNADDLGLSEEEARVIGRVCLGHGTALERGKYESGAYPFEPLDCDGQRVRTECLAAVLRLADALDMEADRADEKLEELFGQEMNPVSRAHFFKHKLVRQVDIRACGGAWHRRISLSFLMPTRPAKLPVADMSDDNLEKWHRRLVGEALCRWVLYEGVKEEVALCAPIIGRELGRTISLQQFELCEQYEDKRVDALMANARRCARQAGTLATSGLRLSTLDDGSTYQDHRTLMNIFLEHDDVHYSFGVKPAFIAPNFWRWQSWNSAVGHTPKETSMVPVRYHQYHKRLLDSEIWSVELWSIEPYMEALLDEYKKAPRESALKRPKMRLEVLAGEVLDALLAEPPMKLILLPAPSGLDFRLLGFQAISKRQVLRASYDGPVIHKRWISEYAVNEEDADQRRTLFEDLLLKDFPGLRLHDLDRNTALAAYALTWRSVRKRAEDVALRLGATNRQEFLNVVENCRKQVRERIRAYCGGSQSLEEWSFDALRPSHF